jgi:glucose/arabinose dehydrogenase
MKIRSGFVIAATLAGILALGGAEAAHAGGAPPIAVDRTLVASGFSDALLVTNAGDGSDRLFVAQKRGRIRIIDAGGATLGTDFLNLSGTGLNLVSTSGNEQGLLGLAFHPDYASNGRFFVSYTQRVGGASVVSEFTVSGNPNVANTTEEIIFGPLSQPFSNHNGGHIAFGPDGMLYLGLGDGGSANDPGNRAQNTTNLLGKILRLDVDATPDAGLNYHVPTDNPFFGMAGFRDEIYIVGVRNPWRYSFDPLDGRLFIGDVGQGSIEEIDIGAAGDNLGWRCYEGNSAFNTSGCGAMGTYDFPIHVFDHSQGRCSVTGGYMYRGARSPDMQGYYFFADYCGGQIYALFETSPGVWQNQTIEDSPFGLTSFGVDEAGEIYVVYENGEIYRLDGPVPTAADGWMSY